MKCPPAAFAKDEISARNFFLLSYESDGGSCLYSTVLFSDTLSLTSKSRSSSPIPSNGFSSVIRTSEIQRHSICQLYPIAAQRFALPAGGWDEITSFYRN